MRSPFAHYLCFNTAAPAIAGPGYCGQLVSAVPGREPGCLEAKNHLCANVIHNNISPQARSVHACGIPRLFTRFSRNADYIGSILSVLEDAVRDVG
jgi:hypothetical protein